MMATGWDDGLCQDYCRGLGKWFADRLGAREQLRRMFSEATHQPDPDAGTDTQHRAQSTEPPTE